MSKDLSPSTGQYLGLRLTVQCDDPNDPFYQPQDFFPAEKSGGVCIGRAGGNDVCLPAVGVSNVHCRILSTAQGLVVEDAGSRNGTHLGSRTLAQGERHLLRDGEVLRILNYHITCRMGLSAFAPEEKAAEEPDSTYQLGREMMQMLLDDPKKSSPHIVVLTGPHANKKFDLKEYEDFVIGRGKDCHLQLPDDAISREHAKIRRDWTGVTIRDLNSRNGVVINGVAIRRNMEVNLHHNDQIALGHFQLVFRDPFAAEIAQKLPGGWDSQASPSVDEHTLPPKAMKARDLDIEEPVSGRWRLDKKAPAPAAPLAPLELQSSGTFNNPLAGTMGMAAIPSSGVAPPSSPPPGGGTGLRPAMPPLVSGTGVKPASPATSAGVPPPSSLPPSGTGVKPASPAVSAGVPPPSSPPPSGATGIKPSIAPPASPPPSLSLPTSGGTGLASAQPPLVVPPPTASPSSEESKPLPVAWILAGLAVMLGLGLLVGLLLL